MRTEGREEIETVLKRKHDKIWQMMSCEKKRIKIPDFLTWKSWDRIINKGRKANISASQVALVVKNPPATAEDARNESSISG